MADMDKIYVLHFNDDGPYCAYTDYERAKRELWQAYMTDCYPLFEESKKEEWLAEDKKTFEESDYIVDYGYINEVPLVVD
jgi:hypothetical protein